MSAQRLRVLRHPVLGDLPEAPMVTIIVDGEAILARDGEPVAAAMLAAGIRVMRTTPSSDKPRGIFYGVGRRRARHHPAWTG